MTIDVEDLAGRTATALLGAAKPYRAGRRVSRLELQEAIAAALTVAVNEAVDQAAVLLRPERVIAALSIRRHLGTTTVARLRRELEEVRTELHALRVSCSCPPAAAGRGKESPCPDPSTSAGGDRARALSPPQPHSTVP